MKKQFLKHLPNALLFLLVIALASCSPTWKDAQEKLDRGEESDAARIIKELAENGDVKAMDWIINYDRQFNPILEENFNNCNKENYTPSTMMFMEKRAADWENGDLARILTKFYSQSGFRDENKANKWAKIGADKGDSYCLYVVGESFCDKEDYKKGLPLLEKSAAGNCKDAVLSLYRIFSFNSTLADPAKSAIYCKKAAEFGDPQAKYEMAKRYFYGEGVEKDVITAHNFIDNLPSAYIKDKELPSAIDKEYKIALQRQETQLKADRLNRIKNIINGGTIWMYKEDGGITYQLRFCSGHILAFERNDLYDPSKSYSVSLKYTPNLSDPLEPRLSFTSWVDSKGVDADWINEVFGGTTMRFSVSGNTMTVSGNHVIDGTYTQRTR